MNKRNQFKIEVGERIRQKREELGLTRDKFCDYVDISVEFLSEIERGVKGPSAETLKKICEGLSLSADYLILGKQQSSDISGVVELMRNIDPVYIPLAEEHLKTLIKTIGLKAEK